MNASIAWALFLVAAPAGKGAGVNGVELECDKLVPAALRDRFLGGMTLKEQGHNPHECNFSNPKNQGEQVFITWQCTRRIDDAGMKAALDALKNSDRKKSGRDIPKLGRGAVAVKFMGFQDQIHVFDDKTPCTILIAFGPEGPKTGQEDIARAVVAATTPAAVGM